jgi:phage gp45-like
MKPILDEVESRMRGLIQRMKPKSIYDAGEAQKVSGIVAHGVHRSGVEVIQPFGFASVATEGSLMLVLAVGGDQGDLVGLPVAAPQRRLGNLQPGEAAVYGSMGQRCHAKADGSIAVASGVKVEVKAPVIELIAGPVTVRIDSSGVHITGGAFTHEGVNVGSTHVHSGVRAGGDISGGPI